MLRPWGWVVHRIVARIATSRSDRSATTLPCEYRQRLPNHRLAVKAGDKLLPHSHCRQSYPAPGSVATTGRGGEDTARPRRQPLAKALSSLFSGQPPAGGTALEQDVRPNADGDPGRRSLDRVPRKMRVAGRRLDLAVPEQLPDHGQTLAKRACVRRDAARHIEEDAMPPVTSKPRLSCKVRRLMPVGSTLKRYPTVNAAAFTVVYRGERAARRASAVSTWA